MPTLSDQPAQKHSVDELAVQVKELVASRQLVMIPTIPLRSNDSGFVVFLGQEDMNASDFLDLAVAAGVKLFYVQANVFNAEQDLTISLRGADDWQNYAESAGGASLRKEASVYNGRISEMQLGFAAGGVLHCWILTAPWYEKFIEQLENLQPDVNPMFERMPEAEARSMIDRLAQELFEMPEFRSAPSAAQRRRLARAQNSEIAALETDNRPGYSMIAYQAVRQAEERVAEDADSRYREIETRLTDLAFECQATPAFQSAGSARARREHARDFLVEKAGGYPPPTRLLELFLDTPPLQRTRTSRH